MIEKEFKMFKISKAKNPPEKLMTDEQRHQ